MRSKLLLIQKWKNEPTDVKEVFMLSEKMMEILNGIQSKLCLDPERKLAYVTNCDCECLGNCTGGCGGGCGGGIEDCASFW